MKKLLLLFSLISFTIGSAQSDYKGEGPYSQLIIRGVTLINGDGAPPRGPIDIVVENNMIKRIQVVGYPGVE
ncbi:MAG: amidohydrolase, partial [Flavobacteriaceae bacterium]|nr:amidohydrolase [Flavobacteriaceae bacterium]